MTEMSEDNIKLLTQISNEVTKASKHYKFEFSDNVNLQKYKEDMMAIITRNCSSNKITPEINKTGLPDAAIIAILENQGCYIESIQDLVEVTQEWKYDDDKKTIHMLTHPTFRMKGIRMEVVLTPKEVSHND